MYIGQTKVTFLTGGDELFEVAGDVGQQIVLDDRFATDAERTQQNSDCNACAVLAGGAMDDHRCQSRRDALEHAAKARSHPFGQCAIEFHH
jgi:hypothetical protein